MKRFFGMAAVAVVALGGVSFATGVDPADSVLVAYKLTPAQSAQFNAADTAVSAFWNLIAETTHDYWKLLPSASTYLNGGAGFANDSDAQMVIKAAYDSAGAYFYFRVLDNQWMTGEGLGWQSDIVDLYIDTLSSSAINAADPATMFINGHLTASCQQHWIAIGGDAAPATIGLNYWDPNQSAFQNTTLDMATAPQKIKMIKVDSITRVLEMFIPWANFGVGGVVSGMGPVGTQYAISGGYNDADSSGNKGCLRILHNGDPYESDQNYWADLELGPQIDGEMVGIKNASRLHASPSAFGKIVKSEYFTLAGRKIDRPAMGKYHTLIRRDRMANGAIVHSIIR